MIPAARIQAVIELLATIIATPRPADSSVSAYFRARRFIGSKDRAAISTRIFRVMRAWHRLGWWIRRCHCDVNARTLVIADLMFEREHSLDSIIATFSGEQYTPRQLNETELKMAKSMDRQNLEHPHMPPREKSECPEWAFDMLQKGLGKKFEEEMRAMLVAAPMDLRVNTLKSTRDKVLAQLIKDGIKAEAGRHSPLSIRVFGRPQVAQHPLYRDGSFEIQDEGSQMIALLADAKPGEQVVDFCAGAGGKTLALGAAMNNKGRIVAMDVLGERLEKAKLRFRRAGLHNVETRHLTSERDKWIKRHQHHFDLVLIDAPCTGTGTWRRSPDQRWRVLGPSIDELLPLQRNILDSACRMVKPGGRIVYATCSLLQEENEHQIEAFLKTHPEFEIKGEFMKLTPASHDTDGFFAAVLTRKNMMQAS
ncbi:MAG: RsmB/NOP family class I SAM-dependent RNA methyltransferase [Proteobacteria bacterium]|nr:RsmB/NOP family class I SAM-dependent RNA methyltransferase [Pseudomonadota bacterium]